jgi:hypothetical protein
MGFLELSIAELRLSIEERRRLVVAHLPVFTQQVACVNSSRAVR